jgi:hypothetical protein
MPGYDYRPGTLGRGLTGLGYYWAISEYADAKVLMDFWDRREEFRYTGALRYKKRYVINGNIRGSLISERSQLLEPADWRWTLSFNHNQTINPTFKIIASGDLKGDANIERNYNLDQDERLNTKLNSGIRISKSLEEIDASLTASTRYSQDLGVTRQVNSVPASAGIILTGPTLTFPDVSFSRSSKPLFKSDGNEDLWYHKLRWSYRTSLNNRTNWEYESYATGDSLGGDSLAWKERSEDRHLWNHNLGLSANTTALKVLNVVGSVNYTDRWVFQYDDALLDAFGNAVVDSNGTLQTYVANSFLRRGTFSTSASLNTKIYGIFPVKLGPLQAIRHTVTPKLTLSYTPDFSAPAWGYVRELSDSSGNSFEFDPYAGTAIGSTPSSRRLNLGYSLSNQFDYKLFRNEVEKKSQFLSLDLNGSYNFEADSLNASDVRSNLRVNLTDKLNLSLRATHELYERDSTGTRKIDVYRSPRLTSAGFSFRFRLAGHSPEFIKTGRPTGLDSLMYSDSLTAALLEAAAEARSGEAPPETEPEPPADMQLGPELWQANLSFSYSLSHSNPLLDPNQSLQMNLNMNFNISPRWTVSYRGSFNVLEQRLLSQNVSIGRDLHCWKLSFNWTPGGFYSGFNLLIQPKATQLRDLKLEHRSRHRFYP